MTAATRVAPVITAAGPRPRLFCDVGLVLRQRDRERVVAVLVGQHVVQLQALLLAAGSGTAAPPSGGLVAGLSAASIDARPGLAIGVGGRPGYRYVLYGVSIDFRLIERQVRVLVVEQRGVDLQRHARARCSG